MKKCQVTWICQTFPCPSHMAQTTKRLQIPVAPTAFYLYHEDILPVVPFTFFLQDFLYKVMAKFSGFQWGTVILICHYYLDNEQPIQFCLVWGCSLKCPLHYTFTHMYKILWWDLHHLKSITASVDENIWTKSLKMSARWKAYGIEIISQLF